MPIRKVDVHGRIHIWKSIIDYKGIYIVIFVEDKIDCKGEYWLFTINRISSFNGSNMDL